MYRKMVFEVIWEDPKADANSGQTCFTSIDGVNWKIEDELNILFDQMVDILVATGQI